ncbi:hypothetical protein ES703_112908 [subsurface metagenome]
MEKVRLAETGPAVDEQGIVVVSRVLGHGQRRGAGQAVAAAFDKRVEGVKRF